MRLQEIERQNTELKLENQSLRQQLDSHESQVNKISRQVRGLEKANEVLQRTAAQFEQEKRGLEREVGALPRTWTLCCPQHSLHYVFTYFQLDTKDYRMRKAVSDKDRLKQDYETKLVLTEHELGRQLVSIAET